jgi:ATP-dependent RNA helicase RhlE
LAAQIGDSFFDYKGPLDLRHHVIFGGVKQRPQVAALRRGVDMLVATPGRLLDLHGQGYIDFNDVEFFVLDEADRMLDMGFIHDIRKVLALLPRNRQNLLFSATMPKSIIKLASGFLHDPILVEVNPESTTVESIVQKVMFVDRPDKKLLLRSLLKDKSVESAIVFTRTKHGANKVVKDLSKAGVEAVAIHGNKSQSARTRALAGFKSGRIRILVATDIASRGIDVDGVSHIFNYDLPNISESYVHRIGRTGRAGRAGIAIAFCDATESAFLRDIEKLIGQEIEVDEDHDWHFAEANPAQGGRSGQRQGGQRGQGPRGQGRSGQDQQARPEGDRQPRHRRGGHRRGRGGQGRGGQGRGGQGGGQR